jgi:hypothetical protein
MLNATTDQRLHRGYIDGCSHSKTTGPDIVSEGYPVTLLRWDVLKYGSSVNIAGTAMAGYSGLF